MVTLFVVVVVDERADLAFKMMLFARLKRILGLARLRLRGPYGVQDEFTLAATAQNLRKLAKLKPIGPTAG